MIAADQNWRVNSKLKPYLSSNHHVSIAFLVQKTKFFPSKLPFLFHARIWDRKSQDLVSFSSVCNFVTSP